MYPQSLHTHSPSQYISALASSSAFWAALFLFPNTFKLVDEAAMVLVDTLATEETGLNAFTDAQSMRMAQMSLIREFMVTISSLSKCFC